MLKSAASYLGQGGMHIKKESDKVRTKGHSR